MPKDSLNLVLAAYTCEQLRIVAAVLQTLLLTGHAGFSEESFREVVELVEELKRLTTAS